MTTEFTKNIEKFLRPLSELNGTIPNEAYFLTKDDLFVFVEGYSHPENKIHGKIIYFPDENGSYDYYGRSYASSFKKQIDGKLILLDHKTQLRTQFQVRKNLKPSEQMPVHAEYRVEFDISEFKGYFDHRYSLKLMMEKYPVIKNSLEDFCQEFNVDINRLGATGSLSFGIFDEEDDDLDLVFYGTVEENKKLLSQTIEHCKNPENVVEEFGKIWPIRFFYKKVLYCPFYCYSDVSEAPIKDFDIETVKESITFEGTVSDDTHSIYFPVFLEMNDCKMDENACEKLPVLIYDSSLRGEYFNGTKLKIKGRLVDIRMKDRAVRAVLATLVDQITILK